MVTFLASERHCHFARTKLYCFPTCAQAACPVQWVTRLLQLQCSNDYTVQPNILCAFHVLTVYCFWIHFGGKLCEVWPRLFRSNENLLRHPGQRRQTDHVPERSHSAIKPVDVCHSSPASNISIVVQIDFEERSYTLFINTFGDCVCVCTVCVRRVLWCRDVKTIYVTVYVRILPISAELMHRY